MNEGIITIRLDGITREQTERCRQMIHQMFVSDVFNVRNGKATLNFDHEGILCDIEISMKTWSRRYPSDPSALLSLDQFKVEMAQDQSTIARSI